MTASSRGDWQVMLADLALILFTVASMHGAGGASRASASTGSAMGSTPGIPVAVYRPPADMADWLRSQPPDPRVRLTITARFVAGGHDAAVADALRMSRTAAKAGFTPRVVVEPGVRRDLFATLSHDRLDSVADMRGDRM